MTRAALVLVAVLLVPGPHGAAVHADGHVALGSTAPPAAAASDPEDPNAPAEGLPPNVERIDTPRALHRRVRAWPNMRLGHPFETWSWDPDLAPELRREAACLADLRKRRVRFVVEDPSPLVPFAVKVIRVPGLTVIGRELVVACEMAARLPDLVALLRSHGVSGLTVMSAWRDHPAASFHTLGLALDLARFATPSGEVLDVARDFVSSGSVETCAAAPPEGKARRLQSIACAIFAARMFSTVLTPNYNAGHRDHFHVDLRPRDERFYLR